MIKIGNNIRKFSTYSCQPKTKEELSLMIKKRMYEDGNKCDLNDIDVSLITDMEFVFCGTDFNGNISNWDVSNVKNMRGMFYRTMFNQDISNWDVSNVENMELMFSCSKFNKDISKWNVNKVKNMNQMFYISKFTGDISNWKINDNCITYEMFDCCQIEEENKPKTLQQR